jgi:hypothetical protein
VLRVESLRRYLLLMQKLAVGVGGCLKVLVLICGWKSRRICLGIWLLRSFWEKEGLGRKDFFAGSNSSGANGDMFLYSILREEWK